ncbi:hypothetical protein EV356DRAFT_488877 [Viridothelium virens]|uniref:Bromodomain associated domain-containing protein n=1 Tax=Viridothelium virens TaxID=1048519 RepID=A0A6A6H3N8_VIRVR|nr:hypothetical protein EV356DRAFT_488877 [Viridothelium virens]
MSSPTNLHNSLLRPPVLHILRAAGFHSLRPSVLDTLTDIAARYIALLAETTAIHATANNSLDSPTITDVRLALQDCGVLVPSLTPAEEAWKEVLRKPLDSFPERNGVRQKETMRRDAEDTADVQAFLDWVRGPGNAEILRIAGLQLADLPVLDGQPLVKKEDYLTALKKKHSKTGEESRYQGTVLGKIADDKPIKIEGGPAETLQDWGRYVREQSKTKSPDRERASSSPLSTLSGGETPMNMAEANGEDVMEA